MNKKSLSSLELAAIVKELQFLARSKISQVYYSDGLLLLQLHVSGEGKQLLKIIPGKLMCLTKIKDTADKPSGFCQQLRKYLAGGIISSISQKDAERIVSIEVENILERSKSQQKLYLIIELFSIGNIILTDKEQVIITALESREWKDRIIKPREKYIPPPLSVNYLSLTKDQLKNLLRKSDRRNLVTFIATEMGLGGLYAEEVCKLAGIDKNKVPKEVPDSWVVPIHNALQDIISKLKDTHGYVYPEDITPFKLLGIEPARVTDTYNEAIDELNPLAKASPYEQKIKSLERIAAEQEESIKKAEEAIIENKRIGELIYENYASLQKMLGIVKEMRKTMEWGEIGEELKRIKKLVRVDLKGKKVVLGL
ncbi:NFACT family protein [Candidatus Woesearchaeota archaeon]|nr:NFACT family protein [Candidatus Woesearchaeota archaeon]